MNYRIVWGREIDKVYEYGLDRGVFYDSDNVGHPWNGLLKVQETEVAEATTPVYMDGLVLTPRGMIETLDLTLTAFTYPPVMEPYLGLSDVATGQGNETFGLSYRVSTSHGAYIHLLYKNVAKMPNLSAATVNDTPATSNFTFQVGSRPIPFSEGRVTSHVIIDTSKLSATNLLQLEQRLYGDEDMQPHLPTIQDLVEILTSEAYLIITDNGDGSWTATGPDDVVMMTGPDTFRIISPSAYFITEDRYSISSY